MAFLDETGLAEVWSLANAKFPHVAIGRYMGTGTKGVNNPTTLTFDFAPKIVMVFKTGAYALNNGDICNFLTLRTSANNALFTMGINMDDIGTSYQTGYFYYSDTDRMVTKFKKSADGKTLYFYNESYEQAQMNSKYYYQYIAIG